MEEIIAGLERFTFAFEQDVELQKGTGLLPFQGMNSEWQGHSFPAPGFPVPGFPLSLLQGFWVVHCPG